MRRASRRDANSAEIQRALRACGIFVQSLEQHGDDVLDLLCCRYGRVALLEVKMPNGKPSKGQVTFMAEWRRHGGTAEIVKTIDQALAVFGIGERVQSERPYSGGGKGRILSEADERATARQPLTVRRAQRRALSHG